MAGTVIVHSKCLNNKNHQMRETQSNFDNKKANWKSCRKYSLILILFSLFPPSNSSKYINQTVKIARLFRYKWIKKRRKKNREKLKDSKEHEEKERQTKRRLRNRIFKIRREIFVIYEVPIRFVSVYIGLLLCRSCRFFPRQCVCVYDSIVRTVLSTSIFCVCIYSVI